MIGTSLPPLEKWLGKLRTTILRLSCQKVGDAEANLKSSPSLPLDTEAGASRGETRIPTSKGHTSEFGAQPTSARMAACRHYKFARQACQRSGGPECAQVYRGRVASLSLRGGCSHALPQRSACCAKNRVGRGAGIAHLFRDDRELDLVKRC